MHNPFSPRSIDTDRAAPVTRQLGLAFLATFAVLALVITPVLPAQAATAAITGTQAYGEVRVWSTPRTNTHSRNYSAVRLDTINGLALGSKSLWLAMRPAGGATYARGQSTYGVTAALKNDLTGNSWNPPGTFYLNSSLSGGCSGAGCGALKWNATLTYNVDMS